MRKLWIAITSFAFIISVLSMALFLHVRSTKASGVSCTPTGFSRDGINLTAAIIDPTNALSGMVDATGCNIGVYFGPGATGNINGATVFGANYFGIVNNGANVAINGTSIHDIGESPFNGDQHGVAIYFTYQSGATGKITNNHIWNYQKAGIVVNGTNDSAIIRDNTVNGLGPIGFIAQNGLQIGYGAQASVMNNTVTGNSYTGTSTVSGGIIVLGGGCYGSPYATGTQIVGNTVIGNDVGIWLTNLQSDCMSPPATQTNIKVVNNAIRNDSVNNDYGGFGYQAGIADQGDNDKMINNTITGAGYNPATSATAYLIWIDASTTFTNRPKIHANSFGP